MRKLNKVLVITMACLLLLAQVASAATVVEGTWMGYGSVAGISMPAPIRVVFDGTNKVRINALGKDIKGTYVVNTNNTLNVTMASNAYGPQSGVVKYSLVGATSKKAQQLNLDGSALGITGQLNTTKQVPKISKMKANKVKRGDVSTVRVVTNTASNFVILYGSDKKEIARLTTKDAKNQFDFKVSFMSKKNVVYAQSGMFDVDGNPVLTQLSAGKKLVVNCK